jgi:hypothetical protein
MFTFENVQLKKFQYNLVIIISRRRLLLRKCQPLSPILQEFFFRNPQNPRELTTLFTTSRFSPLYKLTKKPIPEKWWKRRTKQSSGKPI